MADNARVMLPSQGTSTGWRNGLARPPNASKELYGKLALRKAMPHPSATLMTTGQEKPAPESSERTSEDCREERRGEERREERRGEERRGEERRGEERRGEERRGEERRGEERRGEERRGEEEISAGRDLQRSSSPTA
ncbi:hypothetical protein QYF61_020759 [Mycteria americana]|uniref:Uncharacterized protein n=1 Tax=Mycteria americana TaxID=33587 RepID=A0AAN7RUL8_MYCAM|nr:hypothetical protein QYF61_020759 [Mycteria americana]